MTSKLPNANEHVQRIANGSCLDLPSKLFSLKFAESRATEAKRSFLCMLSLLAAANINNQIVARSRQS